MPAALPIVRVRKDLPRLAAFVWSRPLLVALVLTALLTALRSTGSVDSDVAWQLWIAGRIHVGARLYTDIIETNPPLWFWMAVPVDRLAALLHIRIEAMLVLAIGCLVACSLAATDRLVGYIPSRQRTFLLCYGALALVAAEWMQVGQREQLVLIATIPYAALVAARSEGRPADPRLACLIGTGAALGFALKHYFLLVPLLLEIWLILGQRRRWRAIRPETFALVAVGTIYGAAIFVFEPDFLHRILPLILLAYGDFGPSNPLSLLGPFAMLAIAILAALGTQSKVLIARTAPFASALTVAALGFTAVYFIEFKGWPYHAIPMVGCGSMALASMMMEIDLAPQPVRILGPVLLALPLIFAEEEARNDRGNSDLAQATYGLGPGTPVGFLTTENAIPWSVTLQGGYRYISRYDGYWMLRAIIVNERRRIPDPRLSALGREIVSQTVDDFSCVPPKRIIVSRPRPGEHEFDILPFFERDPRFQELMSHYRVRSRTTFETYDLVSPLLPPTSPCRKGI